MKFSDVKPGMTVVFKNVDLERWAAFHNRLIRSPLYQGPQHYYETYVKPYENKPIIVKEIKTFNTGDTVARPSYKKLIGVFGEKEVEISEKWFSPTDTTAFSSAAISPQMKSELAQEVGTRRQKRMIPVLEKTFPTLPTDVLKQVAKFQVAPPKIAGRKRKTRKTRKLRKTRK